MQRVHITSTLIKSHILATVIFTFWLKNGLRSFAVT